MLPQSATVAMIALQDLPAEERREGIVAAVSWQDHSNVKVELYDVSELKPVGDEQPPQQERHELFVLRKVRFPWLHRCWLGGKWVLKDLPEITPMKKGRSFYGVTMCISSVAHPFG